MLRVNVNIFIDINGNTYVSRFIVIQLKCKPPTTVVAHRQCRKNDLIIDH